MLLEQRAANAELRSLIAQLQTLVDGLQRRLGLNSKNSSKPPSSDPPRTPPAKKPPSGRKPGGQPGHKGSRRDLLPPEKVARIEDLWPAACGKCKGTLPVRWRADVGEPVRHQVTELPPIEPETVEWRLHRQCCPSCRAVTTAALPSDVPRGAFGPRLAAMIAVLSGCYRMSKRTAVEAARDLFGVDLALGSVIACEQAVSETLAAPVAEAHEYVQAQAVLHADETGWREARRRAWLWVGATALVTVFRICQQRGKTAAQALLGSFRGVLITDRWDAYGWYPKRRQICWAHLLRDFRDMSERKGAAGRVGRDLLGVATRIFKLWHLARDGTITRGQLKHRMRPLRLEIERLLKLGTRGGTSIAGSCLEMLKLLDAFFTFIQIDGVEPTNNHAERQIRPAVI